MSDLKLCSSISKKLIACVLLANPIFLSANAQDKPEAVAKEAISNNTAKGDLSRIEEALKQQRELEADNKKLKADLAFKEGNLEEAIDEYLGAIDKYKKVSSSEPRVVQKQKTTEAALSTVYKLHAENLIKEAEKNESVKLFEQAEILLDEVVKFDKNLDQFVSEKKKEISEKKLKAEIIEKIDYKGQLKAKETLDEEKRWRMEQAQILYDNRRFVDAKDILNEILVLDPFDIASNAMIARINHKLFQSAKARRVATVQERIDEVEWKWSLPIQSAIVSGPTDQGVDGKIPLSSEYDKINEKLKIIIPRFKQNAKIADVLKALKEASIIQDPEKKGLTIIYRPYVASNAPAAAEEAAPAIEEDPFAEADPFADPADAGGAAPVADAGGATSADKNYNFDFENMPIGEIIRYICISSNLKYKVDTHAVIVADPKVQVDDMVTRFYPVNSQVFSTIAETGAGGGGDDLVGGIGEVAGGEDEKSVENYLKAMGVQFAAGSTVAYLRGVSRLVVTNTVTEQRRIQEILNQLQVNAAQVIIESKFVEINQGNLEEFGFQWSLQQTAAHNERINFIPNLENQYNVITPGEDNNGDGDFDDPGLIEIIDVGPPAITNTIFEPDVVPEFGPAFNSGFIGNTNIPVNFQGGESLVGPPDAVGGLSTGIRALGSILTDPDGMGTTQGQLSFTSILGGNRFNTIVRALSQQTNTDVLSAPKVITQNGNTAVIRVVEERYFPESWEPPTINTLGGGGGNNGNQATVNITPSQPNFGDPRDVGVVLEVTPQVDPDGVSIEIELKPQVVEFLRFDSTFNTPIYVNQGQGAADYIQATARYDMPILSARSIDTRVKIWDGETVVLGGLLQEKVTTVEDKIPILGDIPLIGFLFKNEGENHAKRNLLIFVSARLVNNAGLPIRENNIRGLPDFKRL